MTSDPFPISDPFAVPKPKAEKMISTLRGRWPGAFSVPPRPLAISTFAAISAALYPRDHLRVDWSICPNARVLSAALERWVRSPDYLKSCTRDAARVDLQGDPVGRVTAEEARYASAELLRLEKLRLCSVRDKDKLAEIDAELRGLTGV